MSTAGRAEKMSIAPDLLRPDGDVVVIPLALIPKIGLQASAFLRQAVYLSSVVKKNDGWFFLEQEGAGDPSAETIFQRLGSWQYCLGIGPDAQVAIRKKLGKNGLGLLEETRKGMVHGRMLYKVDSQKYLKFLAECTTVSTCLNGQKENPDCTNVKDGTCKDGEAGLHNRHLPKNNNKEDDQVDLRGELPPPPNPSGGNALIPTKSHKPSAEIVTIFLMAAGNPEELLKEVEKLSREIEGATSEQAKLAGMAWRYSKNMESPVGLAVGLCRKAAAGSVTPCAEAVEEAKALEKSDIEKKYARLQGLHGKKYLTQEGSFALVDRDCIYICSSDTFKKPCCVSGSRALECLCKIEEGYWEPI